MGTSDECTQLSAIDVTAQGSEFEFKESGGRPSVVLDQMRNRSVWVDTDLDIESVWQFSSDFIGARYDHPEKSLDEIIRNTLPSELKKQLPEWEKTAQTQPFGEYVIEGPYRFLDAALQPRRVTLPTYNLHVFDPSSSELRKFRERGEVVAPFNEGNDSIKVADLIRVLRHWFRSQGDSAVPLTFGYCEILNPVSESCDQMHSLVLVGVGTLCDSQGICKDVWKIRGSSGGQGEGWFDAERLAYAVFRGETAFTYLQPCRNEGDLVGGAMEACSPEILGLNFGKYDEGHKLGNKVF